MELIMKKGKLFICDALIAIALIVGINACDRQYDTHQLVKFDDSTSLVALLELNHP